MRIYIPLALWVACLNTYANNAVCTNRNFHGVYAFHSQAWNVTNNAPLTFAGSLTADGNGKITAWKDVAATAAAQPIVPPNFKAVSPVLDRHAQAKSLGVEILYSVDAECMIMITAEFVGPTGNRTPSVMFGALANRGREALLMNAAAQSPYVSLITMKRASGKDVSSQRKQR